jgi:hypothetical protein
LHYLLNYIHTEGSVWQSVWESFKCWHIQQQQGRDLANYYIYCTLTGSRYEGRSAEIRTQRHTLQSCQTSSACDNDYN